MVTHIVMWNFKEQLTDEQKAEAGEKIRELLEPLAKKIKGVLSLKVILMPLGSSTKDVALIGEYESEEALQGYAVHPLHVEAGTYIKSVTCNRECLDY